MDSDSAVGTPARSVDDQREVLLAPLLHEPGYDIPGRVAVDATAQNERRRRQGQNVHDVPFHWRFVYVIIS